MKSLTLAATFFLASSAQTPLSPGKPLDICAFDLVFSEEFDTLSVNPWMLDGKRWIAHTPWNGDFGDARFLNPGPEGPFGIEDGKLVITARKGERDRWGSGLLAAADKTGAGTGVRYGYFEASMKLPPGPGLWPAFWLISLKPTSDNRPKVEIDVIEYYGHRTNKYSIAMHVWFLRSGEGPNRSKGDRISVTPGQLTERFHTFGVEVDPEHVTYYFDRVQVARFPTPPEHQTPLHPLVNLAMGPGYPIDQTPDPSRLYVDYVRIYERNEAEQAARCAENAPGDTAVQE
ncbi:glycoside hydrolase family 16 protein [Altererythrobacter arenosus]|uniref:Glycoside hydrolase family 16 protein n=1 Tax=Altererythrobacter arenosus TaxID=3032592 RepID=A0ABY8FTN5_9SPHN|nr:glycoside hydrolase family 16 protein [Altererythrobacter sp. CAU 1644]WFL78330.1 glycoside hydrolase family 16 protein [Altererythrobacter sp. CAU 1644]